MTRKGMSAAGMLLGTLSLGLCADKCHARRRSRCREPSSTARAHVADLARQRFDLIALPANDRHFFENCPW